MEVHHNLEPLKKEIESESINLDTDKLPDIKATMLEKAKNDEHFDKIEQLFDRIRSVIKWYESIIYAIIVDWHEHIGSQRKDLMFKACLN